MSTRTQIQERCRCGAAVAVGPWTERSRSGRALCDRCGVAPRSSAFDGGGHRSGHTDSRSLTERMDVLLAADGSDRPVPYARQILEEMDERDGGSPADTYDPMTRCACDGQMHRQSSMMYYDGEWYCESCVETYGGVVAASHAGEYPPVPHGPARSRGVHRGLETRDSPSPVRLR